MHEVHMFYDHLAHKVYIPLSVTGLIPLSGGQLKSVETVYKKRNWDIIVVLSSEYDMALCTFTDCVLSGWLWGSPVELSAAFSLAT